MQNLARMAARGARAGQTRLAYAGRMGLWDAIRALWQFLVLVGRFLGWPLGIGPAG